MDPASTTIIDCLQKRIAELDRAYAALEQDHRTLMIIAASALRTLCQCRDAHHLEGLWIQAKHVPYLRDHFNRKSARLDLSLDDRTWTWQQFPSAQKRSLPVFPDFTEWTKEELEAYTVEPFKRAFPVELFEAIVSSADRQTISRAASASVTCYQLCMPLLLERVYVSDRKHLNQVFAGREAELPKSLRLDFAQSLRHVRSVCVSSGSLFGLGSSFALDPTRLLAGAEILYIDRLTIRINTRRMFLDGRLVSILPPSSQAFLSCLSPRSLIVDVGLERYNDPEITFALSRDASLAMSRWPRLQKVRLSDVNLLASLDGTETQLHDESDGVFFLSHRGDELKHPGEIEFIWDVSTYLVSTPPLGYSSFLDLLLHRDATLRQPWCKSFTVIVRTKEIGGAFQKQIDESEEEVPRCLRWEVMKPEDDKWELVDP